MTNHLETATTVRCPVFGLVLGCIDLARIAL